jgi:hypothetical protein
MKYYIDPILAECRQRKAELMEEYGSIEALGKYLDEQRPYREAQGWHFVTPEEHAARIARHKARQ